MGRECASARRVEGGWAAKDLGDASLKRLHQQPLLGDEKLGGAVCIGAK